MIYYISSIRRVMQRKLFLITLNQLPLRFRKAGRVWCDGAREKCHNGLTVSKSKKCLKFPCFSGSFWYKNKTIAKEKNE